MVVYSVTRHGYEFFVVISSLVESTILGCLASSVYHRRFYDDGAIYRLRAVWWVLGETGYRAMYGLFEY